MSDLNLSGVLGSILSPLTDLLSAVEPLVDPLGLLKGATGSAPKSKTGGDSTSAQSQSSVSATGTQAVTSANSVQSLGAVASALPDVLGALL